MTKVPQPLREWLCAMTHHAANAYAKEWNDYHFFTYYKVLENGNTGVRVHIAGTMSTLIIAFAGTEPLDIRDWLLNLSISGETCTFLQGEVHSGFLKGYKSVRTQLINCVTDYIYNKPRAEIICVGHSLGGALAELCHADLTAYAPKVSSVTIGAPALFSKKAAVKFKELCGNTSYRIVNAADIVPRIAQVVGWRNASDIVYADRDAGLIRGASFWYILWDRIKHGILKLDWQPDGLYDHRWQEYVRVVCDTTDDAVVFIET